MNATFTFAVLCILGLSATLSLSEPVQVGNRFLQGIQLGNGANCSDAADNGLLRFNEGLVEFCRDGSWLLVGSNDTVELNSDLLELRQRVLDLEENVYPPLSLEALNQRMDDNNELLRESNDLSAIQMCNFNGRYDAALKKCVCFCDAENGCWNASRRCTECYTGWVGEFCTGDVADPVITLSGSAVVVIEASSVSWADPGASAWDHKDGDLSSSIVVSGDAVDNDTPGTYVVVYSVSDAAGNSASESRTVIVEDTTAPTAVVNGDAVVTREAGSSPYVDAGVTVDDNADNPISVTNTADAFQPFENTTGTYNITYSVVDGSSNAVSPSPSRSVVVVDTQKPVITLNGDSDMEVWETFPYVEAGASVADNADDPLPPVVIDASSVDTNVIGNYSVTYDVTDASGNAADTVTRTVRVVEIPVPIGSTSLYPGQSCLDILQTNASSTTGEYWIQPAGASTPFQVYCEMDTAGGGWTRLVFRAPSFNHPGWSQASFDSPSSDGYISRAWHELSNFTEVMFGSDPSYFGGSISSSSVGGGVNSFGDYFSSIGTSATSLSLGSVSGLTFSYSSLNINAERTHNGCYLRSRIAWSFSTWDGGVSGVWAGVSRNGYKTNNTSNCGSQCVIYSGSCSPSSMYDSGGNAENILVR